MVDSVKGGGNEQSSEILFLKMSMKRDNEVFSFFVDSHFFFRYFLQTIPLCFFLETSSGVAPTGSFGFGMGMGKLIMSESSLWFRFQICIFHIANC